MIVSRKLKSSGINWKYLIGSSCIILFLDAVLVLLIILPWDLAQGGDLPGLGAFLLFLGHFFVIGGLLTPHIILAVKFKPTGKRMLIASLITGLVYSPLVLLTGIGLTEIGEGLLPRHVDFDPSQVMWWILFVILSLAEGIGLAYLSLVYKKREGLV